MVIASLPFLVLDGNWWNDRFEEKKCHNELQLHRSPRDTSHGSRYPGCFIADLMEHISQIISLCTLTKMSKRLSRLCDRALVYGPWS